jgi:hypothetical protein
LKMEIDCFIKQRVKDGKTNDLTIYCRLKLTTKSRS